MQMPVGELRERMSQSEYIDWQAYYGLQSQRAELEARRRR